MRLQFNICLRFAFSAQHTTHRKGKKDAKANGNH